MLKEPHPGRVKTRLGRDIGYVEAAHWYRTEALRTIRRLRSPKWDLILAVSPDNAGQSSRVWPAHVPRIAQGHGDLGKRMARLLRALHPHPTCIIGSDIPTVRPHDIETAFRGLGSHDATIGPSPDGGYWLIGLKNTRAVPSGFLNHVRWSSHFARADTLESCPDLTWHIGRTLNDIDTRDDLIAWMREKRGFVALVYHGAFKLAVVDYPMNKIPTKAEIQNWISEHPTQTSKRDIAKAFGIKGAARIDLKRILKELEAEGHLTKRSKTYRDPDKLPPVSVLAILGPDKDGDLFARPLEWTGDEPEPRILMVVRDGDSALGEGERILAKLQEIKGEDHQYQARLIRKIGTNPHKILGVFRKSAEGGRVLPIDKGSNKDWLVKAGNEGGAKDGELVEAEQSGPTGRMGLPVARIVTRLGDPTAPKAVSLIAIHQLGIPDDFPDAVIDEADAATPADLTGREDLRDVPLVTIDPADARDHDDAIWAEADGDPNNKGGFILWVAIADVAHYVTPGSQLDREAWTRGNSSYFPDRVVPMLPDRLSGDLCSLHEGVPRACLAVKMTIDAQGKKLKHTFLRGLMRSAASLNYAEVQQARDGAPNEKCARLMESVIDPIYQAYDALKNARSLRQPLELDLPERKIILGEDGRVKSVNFAERFDAHKLIEEFMVLANVSAAEELFHRNRPLLYRVHEEPSDEKLDALREIAGASGFTLAKGQVLHTSHLNRLLAQAAGTDQDDLINISTLRSMTQAYYHPENFGHFGLALRSYAHFTSPIRRYADLIVHRALVSAHGWGKDGLSPDEIDRLEVTAKHISETERRSMTAERDTTDRYLASYLSERIGDEMAGHISGIQKFGLFVKLDETGADGLVPVRSIGREFFVFDPERQTLMGSDTGVTLAIGQSVLVKIADASPITGGLELELLQVEGENMPGGARRGPSKYRSRKHGKNKAKQDKARKKVVRRRH